MKANYLLWKAVRSFSVHTAPSPGHHGWNCRDSQRSYWGDRQGAQITLTNQATQVVQTTQSISTGAYVFSSVPVGTYTLTADASGLKTTLSW